MRAPWVLLVPLLWSAAASADTRGGRWLRERGSFEWLIGTGGWRTSLGLDPKVPGFDALAGGGEVLLGLDIGSGVGIIASGRVLAGKQGGEVYIEGLAGLGIQVRVSETVRLRAGPAAGQAYLPRDRAVLVGGFLVASIDLFALGSGRLALALSARLDIDAMLAQGRSPTERAVLPEQSLALAVGLGIRY
jgi:hypothetical protein